MNALKHGFRSQAKIREYQRIRYVLRLAAQNIALLRLHIRARDAGLRIRYKFLPSALQNGRRILNPTSPLRGGRSAVAHSARRIGWGIQHRQIRIPRALTLAVSAPSPWD
jgi:hypothetical protein